MQTSNSVGKKLIFLSVITFSMFVSRVNSGPEEARPLTRRKRYVVFPEGSSFSVALCITVNTLSPDSIFTEGVNWGISYDLPNESRPELDPFLQLRKDQVQFNKYKKADGLDDYRLGQHYYPKTVDKFGVSSKKQKWYHGLGGNEDYYKAGQQHYLQRRYRRDLYNKIEVIINAMGFNGRTCIFRALCEASQRLMPRGKTLIEEMMRVVFALPMEKLFPFEPEEHHAYARAHESGREARDCAALFPECGFSLIDMALGKYSDTGSEAADNLGQSPERLAGMVLASRFADVGLTMK